MPTPGNSPTGNVGLNMQPHFSESRGQAPYKSQPLAEQDNVRIARGWVVFVDPDTYYYC
jgi:hypothetical protein